MDNSYFLYLKMFILALYWKYGIKQFKFIFLEWDVLTDKFTDSYQPPYWWQFYHNTKALTFSHNL